MVWNCEYVMWNDDICPYSYDLRWPFTGEKMSADGKPVCGCTRNFTDSARKRNRKEVLMNYNKTRINIGHQHNHWIELKEAFRVQTHPEV